MPKKLDRRSQKQSGKKFRRSVSESTEFVVAQDTPGVRFKPLSYKNQAQKRLIEEIQKRTIVFTVGPAGSGKTYVSTSMAAQALYEKTIDKIIITRPQVPCEEEMGFLPGDESEKFAPWILPIIEVLQEKLGAGFVKYALANGKITCRPLMTMRGASFKDSWIILDEAQNCTERQMKMFLTRIGENCKVIVSGDLEQSDLGDGSANNGLSDAIYRIGDLADVGVVTFTKEDCVRSGVVRQILDRY